MNAICVTAAGKDVAQNESFAPFFFSVARCTHPAKAGGHGGPARSRAELDGEHHVPDAEDVVQGVWSIALPSGYICWRICGVLPASAVHMAYGTGTFFPFKDHP